MSKRKPLPPTYFNIFLILIFASHYLLRFVDFIRYPYTLLGFIPIIAGIYFNLSADKDFKKASTTVKPFEESTTLITTGVFRITRNPMYMGMFLILFGIAIILGSIIPFIFPIAYGFMMHRVFIKAEEKMLHKVFGTEWDVYKNNVRRWI